MNDEAAAEVQGLSGRKDKRRQKDLSSSEFFNAMTSGQRFLIALLKSSTSAHKLLP